MENSEIVAEWIAENRPLIDLWISEATRLFWKNSSVRVPRTEAERRNGMEGWLEKQRLKLGADLQAQIENNPHRWRQVCPLR